MKILVTDDHALFREGLKYLLRQLGPRLTVLEAKNSDECLTLVRAHADLDLVLLDLGLSGIDGFQVLDRLRGAWPDIPVVIISASEDPGAVRRAIESGALGFIPKSATGKEMIDSVRRVLQGEIAVPPSSGSIDSVGSTRLPASSRPTGASGLFDRDVPPGERLTLRQLEVLSLICEGMSNKEICGVLGLAEGTVKLHVNAILKALGVSSRTRAVLAAQQLGLVRAAGDAQRPPKQRQETD